MDNWNEKLKGLLHDPAYKFLNIKGHEHYLEDIYETLDLKNDKVEADPFASSLDRFLFPNERENCNSGRICQNFLGQNAIWNHTLGGSKIQIDIFKDMSEKEAFDLAGALNKKFIEKMIDPIKNLKTSENNIDYKRMFLKIWWDLPYWIEKTMRTNLIPADTRIPNHSIADHLFMTSSLSGIKEPAFVFFSIGPVQSFISSARKTMDLWAGSYLLSDLSMECMLTVADEFGPDSIAFPDIHKQARVKQWLENIGVPIEDQDTLDPSLPSVPNRFLAIVELNQAEKIVKKVEERLNQKWKKISNDAKKYFDSKGWLEDSDLWDKQTATFPEFYHSIFKWPKEVDKINDIFKSVFGSDIKENENVKILVETFDKISTTETYEQNVGPYYGLFFETARRLLDSVKMTTQIPSYSGKDSIDKDTISGSFEWVAKYPSIEKDEVDERLNALDAVKRFCSDELYKHITSKSFKITGHVPSTDEIAFGKLLSEGKKHEIKKEGAKIAVLVMDGDHMGRWISGENAPEWKNAFSYQTLNDETFKKYIKNNFLESKRLVFPAYHRSISKALLTFTEYVNDIVKIHGGLLIYAGGDDVMAFLPALEAFECANDLRKIFSGKYFKPDCVKSCECKRLTEETHFESGFVFEGNRPVAQLMGLFSSVSAGIAVGHYKYPLSELLKYAKKAEHLAKEGGRDSFCLYTVRRSGQISVSQSKWDYSGNDVLKLAEDILSNFTKDDKEVDKISPKLIKILAERRFYPDMKYSVIPDLKIAYEEGDLKLYLQNLIKRRFLNLKNKNLLEPLSDKLQIFFTPDQKSSNDQKSEFLISRTNLLNEMLFAKRNDERGDKLENN